jgi:enamine deaminase RidA (YjgF/YER057c/UK114 family)
MPQLPNESSVVRYDPFDGALGFSLATRVGDLVYTSGMVGVDANLEVPSEPADEFRQVFENLAPLNTPFDAPL